MLAAGTRIFIRSRRLAWSRWYGGKYPGLAIPGSIAASHCISMTNSCCRLSCPGWWRRRESNSFSRLSLIGDGARLLVV